MKNAFIIHGSFGSPEENWIPWLRTQLEENDYSVTVPQFPIAEEQNLENWLAVIEPHLEKMNENTLLVGHSIGPAFIMSLLERLEKPVAKVVLVSGFLGLLGDEMFDEVNKTISDREFNWEKIKSMASEFVVLHGTDDPYLPTEKAIELGKPLDVEPIMIKNGGHLNADAGFTKFPKLLEEILR